MKKKTGTYKDITTFKEACDKLKMPTTLPSVTGWPKKHRKYAIADYKLVIVVQAMNTDEKGKLWEPNYNDPNQVKYFPYFGVKASKTKPAGFGFSYSFFVNRGSYSFVGSRLCFDSSDKVAHIQKHFKDLFIDKLLMTK